MAILAALVIASASGRAADPANGWRGKGTGLWPQARAPLLWYRYPKGVITDLRASADRPDQEGSLGAPLEKGIIRDWLVLGPFTVNDSVLDFKQAHVVEERGAPSRGDKVGLLTWQPFKAPHDDRWAFGPASPPFADLAAVVGGFKPNQFAYAHVYLHTPKGGTVRAVVDHMFGMKAWLDGKEVYAAPERRINLGSYYALSRVEFGTDAVVPSPRFDLDLKPGWNRLLLRISTLNREDKSWNQQSFLLRLMDLPTVAYENKNILWMTELPQRSNATPIVVGDRLFVMAEPDELLCLDKQTGKILWTVPNNYYDTLTPAERDANPAFGKTVEPLLAQIKKEADFAKRLKLRAEVKKALAAIDEDRFAWRADGHFEAHFGIVGFTSPAPVSDGKHVWVWCGNGVAACYDRDGKRQWITRVNASELSYSSSPALADGTLAVFLGRLVGLDANTGRIRWEQKKIRDCSGAILAATIANVPVFLVSAGHIVRARDGHVLYRERTPQAGAWGPPVILGNRIYLSRYGARNLLVLDFDGVSGDQWLPKRSEMEAPAGVPRSPDGKGRDRSTPASPLVVDDLVYTVDIYSTLYVFDVKAKKLLYHQDTELNGLFHYNAVPVAASPTLIGNHIVIQDNQGTALVLEPGRTFKQVGKNRLATQLERWWPIPAQETTGYSPPVSDQDRLYIRGERYLYCIGIVPGQQSD